MLYEVITPAQVVHDPLLDAGTREVELFAGFDLLLGVEILLRFILIAHRQVKGSGREPPAIGLYAIGAQRFDVTKLLFEEVFFLGVVRFFAHDNPDSGGISAC